MIDELNYIELDGWMDGLQDENEVRVSEGRPVDAILTFSD